MSNAYAGPKTTEYRLWHIPQIPMKAFTRDFDDLAEAQRALDMLADYDLFQYENRVKPDYSNAGGVMRWNADDGCYEELDEDEVDELLAATR